MADFIDQVDEFINMEDVVLDPRAMSRHLRNEVESYLSRVQLDKRPDVLISQLDLVRAQLQGYLNRAIALNKAVGIVNSEWSDQQQDAIT